MRVASTLMALMALAACPKPSVRCPAGMAGVPGGTFKMEVRGDQVTVASFCLDVTEVTAAAYASCKPCVAAETQGLCNGGKPDRQDHPVNCVDWVEADVYCRTVGKRLPTEEEFEWAARGGEAGRTYPWGNQAPGKRARWRGENDLDGTSPVGSHPEGASAHGIQDLAGNVWEWTSTPDGEFRVDRGGGWRSTDTADLRPGRRVSLNYAVWGDTLGFRCATAPAK